MGSSASKGVKAAAGASARKYPTRAPPSTTRTPVSAPPPPQQYARTGPSVHAPPRASEARTEAIDLDARDPLLASRLSSLGAVQPNPHYSATSISSFDPQRNRSLTLPADMMDALPQSIFPDPRDNPALRVLDARQRIQEEADQELVNVGRRGFEGRKYVDAGVIQWALRRRGHGESDARIEEALTIKKGRLGVLGKGIVGSVSA